MQPLVPALWKSCSKNFRKIHMKARMPESLFDKIVAILTYSKQVLLLRQLQLSRRGFMMSCSFSEYAEPATGGAL